MCDLANMKSSSNVGSINKHYLIKTVKRIIQMLNKQDIINFWPVITKYVNYEHVKMKNV